ncbi:MAG: lysine--tRNA ligase [Magnetococcales bacterium]|nr:lysine--tRNA ligase [Magnetococcales bacterium]|tara:strand:+ start:12017 stop:13507 length:1491 start_codon:yes stop_codon:yes gene_type:complete
MTTEQKFYEERLSQISKDYYPHKFNVTHSIKQIIKDYSYLNAGDHTDKTVSICGRVMLKRSAGKKLIFFTIEESGNKVQIMSRLNTYANQDKFISDMEKIHRGDIVGVKGTICKTRKGELSVLPLEMIILAPCLHTLPKQEVSNVKDKHILHSSRYLDLIMNSSSRETFLKRSQIVHSIRSWLNYNEFVEVETPILASQAGGASAKPFKTFHNELKQEMYMRIAPELYLKKLVVGGIPRVFEIGKQFRNEGMDTTHQPEFTTLEWYMAYGDYNDLMKMTENLLSFLAMKINKSFKIELTDVSENTIINFEPPYAKIDIIKFLEEKFECEFPIDYNTIEAREFLFKLLESNGIKPKSPITIPRLLDQLIGEFIEPLCINPTFLMNHPLIMSPLAKYHRDKPHLSERFELFVNGMEICNAYTELNDPIVQKENFMEQMSDRANGDDEAHELDKSFITALEYGLPPTAGFGMGIDRLTMILTNNSTIRDVVLFPTLKKV